MGIYGLLPSIKSIQQKKHLRDFKGLTVAIDSYCWLHKGSYGIAHELMKYKCLELLVSYCVKKIEMLVKYDITPIFVFDGANLPMKDQTEENRDKNRAAKIALAEKYLADGYEEEANRKFSEAIDITPLHAYALILALKRLKIAYYVAPYEADAQLAYLAKAGIADVVFTEDSDLLPFGAKRVFMKMDKNGYGIEINLDDLKKVEELNMQSFDQTMFLSV
jgi:exonuclease-1